VVWFGKGKSMIVKVQLSENSKQMTIRTEDESFLFEGEATQEVEDLMGRDKALFFYVDQINGKIKFLKEARWQGW